MLSLPWYESGEKELTVLPQDTNVIVTKSMFIELWALSRRLVVGGW
jgi:hypothetical protein